MAAPGTLVVLQSGGPTAVVNASLVGAAHAACSGGVSRVLGARFGFDGILNSAYVDLGALSDRNLALLQHTPGAALGSSRQRPSDDEIEQALRLLRDNDVRWVVAIGGNDTAETLHRLHACACATGDDGPRVVGIPKTIDNDLPGMDHCPGYGSAARYLALALREAAVDTAAMQRTDPIKIIEAMGRNAGWLAAASTLGREVPSEAPQVVFLPERPRPLEQMVDEIMQAHTRNGWVVAVICENQRDEAGNAIGGGEPVYVDAHGHPYHESVAAYLARKVQAELGVRARYERPGSLQRTSTLAISMTDAEEAAAAGAEAVRFALGGESDVMVSLHRNAGSTYSVSYGTVPLSEVAHQERRLPDEFIGESGVDITPAFIQYAEPLIGGPLPPLFHSWS